jgi:hypothetical protein
MRKRTVKDSIKKILSLNNKTDDDDEDDDVEEEEEYTAVMIEGTEDIQENDTNIVFEAERETKSERF